jgi:hypothetical protein
MRKLLRDVITAVREAGGANVLVSEGGKHTRISFTGPDGKQSAVLIHRGTAVADRLPAILRSQIRRKLAK